MEKEDLKNVEMSEKLCPECESPTTVSKPSEYNEIFYPEIITIIKKISEKVKNFLPNIQNEYPPMDCHNLCAAKGMANRLIEHLEDPNSLVLLQQLSEILISDSDCKFVPGRRRSCILCGLKFRSVPVIITHLKLRHPEYLALVHFLRRRPLSELKLQKGVVVLGEAKSQELLMQITSPIVLSTRHSFVELDKAPSHQECFTEGNVEITENIGTPSHFDSHQKCNPIAISAEEMKKIEQVVENSPFSDKKNIAVVLIPKNILTTPLGNSNSESASCKERDNTATVPTTIRYGVEDLKMERLRKQLQKETIAKKEDILRQILAKYDEKEIRKEVLRCQKNLTKYVMQHQELLFNLKPDLTTARQSATSQRCRENLIRRVRFSVKNTKIRKAVVSLLKKLFDTMDQVPVEAKKKLSITNCLENVNEVQNCSPSKDEKCGTSSLVCEENSEVSISPSVCEATLDPYSDTTLITDDKQFFECSCGKLNCLGLHPENFY